MEKTPNEQLQTPIIEMSPLFTTRPKILVAEDQPAMRRLVALVLREAGYDVVELQDGEALWRELQEADRDEDNPRRADLVVSDLRMPGSDGLEVLTRLRASGDATPVIMMTAFGTTATVVDALGRGANLVFSKPLDLSNLVAAAKSLVSVEEEGGQS